MATNGKYTLTPLDLAMLEILPDEGQVLGFNPIALSVGAILARPEFKDVTAARVGGRMKSLAFQGLVRSQVIMPVQSGLGWQRTPEGKRVLERAKKGATV